MKHASNLLKSQISVAVLWLVGCVVVFGIVLACEDLASGHRSDIHQSTENSQGNNALRSLALALSSGKEAMRRFRSSRSEKDPDKDKLNPPIAGMDCYLDRITTYVSCHSSLVYTEEEAVTRFTLVIDEVEAALPPDRWTGASKEFGTGTASIRSYTYEDQNSYAHIDIDIIAGTGPSGQSFYMVSLFAWPHY